MSAQTLKDLNFPHQNDIGLSAMIPWRNHLDENTLGSSDGSLMQIVQLGGLSTVGLSEEQIQNQLENRTQALKTIHCPELGIHFYCTKRRISTNNFNDVSGLSGYPLRLGAAIKASLTGPSFIITWYAAFILSAPLSKKLKLFDWLSRTIRSDEEGELRARIHRLHNLTQRFIAQQSVYKPRLLGVYNRRKIKPVLFSEPMQFLRFIAQGKWQHVAYSSTQINQRIVTDRVIFNRNGFCQCGALFFKNTNPIEYDQVLPLGSLNALLKSDIECQFSLGCRYLLRADAQSQIRLNMKQLEGVGDDGISQIAAMQKALDMLVGGEICFTKSFMSITVFGDSPTAVNQHLEAVRARFTDLSGFLMSENTVTAKAVYLSTIPGNWRFAVRNTNGLHSLNIAALISYENFPSGCQSSEWSADSPLLTLTTEHSTAFHFNYHAPGSDLGHCTITGQSGGGKTVLMAVQASMATRYNARLFLLDYDRGQEIFIQALGGLYTVIAPGTRTAWNPFDLPKGDDTLAFVSRLVENMIKLSGVQLKTTDFTLIQAAVSAVFNLPRTIRRLGVLPSYLPAGDNAQLAEGLAQWIGTGGRSWLFDNPSGDALKFTGRYYGYDLTQLAEDKTVSALTFSFLAFAVETYLVDGNPIVFQLDEGWAWLEEELAAERVKTWARTGRRNKIVLCLATNNANVVGSTSAGRELAIQSPTNIFLASPNSKASDYAAFDLRPEQIKRILAMSPEQRQLAIKQNGEFVVVNFNIGDAQEQLEVISSRKETIPLMHAMKHEHGDDANLWLPHFMRAALEHRADKPKGS